MRRRLKKLIHMNQIFFCKKKNTTTEHCVYNSTWGCATPLGWPRSVYRAMLNTTNLWRVILLSHPKPKFPGILEFKWPNDLEGQGQWPPFPISAEIIPRCIFDANLVIIAQIYYKLSYGQTEFARILSQNGQNDLEGQGQRPLFSIPADSIPRCMLGANLVIPAHICYRVIMQTK